MSSRTHSRPEFDILSATRTDIEKESGGSWSSRVVSVVADGCCPGKGNYIFELLREKLALTVINERGMMMMVVVVVVRVCSARTS